MRSKIKYIFLSLILLLFLSYWPWILGVNIDQAGMFLFYDMDGYLEGRLPDGLFPIWVFFLIIIVITPISLLIALIYTYKKKYWWWFSAYLFFGGGIYTYVYANVYDFV